MKKCLYVYPWDFVDEGVETVLARVKSLGIDTLAVALSYHAGKFVLPHNPRRAVYFPEDGVVYFRPDPDYYQSGPIQPVAASVTKDHDFLSELAPKCAAYGIELQAWLVCLHNSRLGGRHPELTVRNVYGDAYPYALCPSRPEVAEYVQSLLKDFLEHYPVRRVFLESLSFCGFAHGYHHEFYGVDLDLARECLLSLCFCDACRAAGEQAGLDMESLSAWVKTTIRRAWDGTVESKLDRVDSQVAAFEDQVKQHPGLARFIEMRCQVVTGLVSRARDLAGQAKAKCDFFGPVFLPSCRLAAVEGVDLNRIGRVVDHYVLPASQVDPSEVESEIEHVTPQVEPVRVILSLNLQDRCTPSKENFTAKIALADKHGLCGCNFYNYGTVPLSKLEWIKAVP